MSLHYTEWTPTDATQAMFHALLCARGGCLDRMQRSLIALLNFGLLPDTGRLSELVAHEGLFEETWQDKYAELSTKYEEEVTRNKTLEASNDRFTAHKEEIYSLANKAYQMLGRIVGSDAEHLSLEKAKAIAEDLQEDMGTICEKAS